MRVQVGNEFGAVEALWSQFENVMAKDPGEGEEGKNEGSEVAEEGGEGEEQTDQRDANGTEEPK